MQVVVGARSALFLPFRDLGLIVVDEEHDPAYKQEDGVLYHARDMAVVRGRIAGFPVVLASATPSVESRGQCAARALPAVSLPERFGGAALPADRGDRPAAAKARRAARFIAPRLAEACRSRSSEASRRCCSSTGAAMRR